MIPAAAPILLEAALRALLAAAVLWVGLRLLRVRNVPAQKTAWGLVLAVALAMPLLMRIPLPAWAEIPLPALAAPHAALVPAVAPAPEPILAPLARSAPAPAPAVPKPSPAHRQSAPEFAPSASDALPSAVSPSTAFDPPSRLESEEARTAAGVAAPARAQGFPAQASLSRLQILWGVYLLVTAALLLRLLLGLASSLRLWFRAHPVEISGHSPLIAVRASERIASPVNIGSGIVLPADFRAWDEEKLRVVLAHETSHVRQRDFYLQLLAGLYAALLWFSPLGWWLKRKLSELGEAISDRAALDAAASPSAYAQMLLEFAVLPRTRTAIPSSGVAMAHAHHLSARIERLLNDAAFRQSFGRSRRALAALLIVPVALLASTALARVHAAETPRSLGILQAVPQQPSSDSTAQPHPDPSQADQSQSTDSTQQLPPPAAPAPPSAPAAPAPAPPPAPGADNTISASPIIVGPINIPDINLPAIDLSAIKFPQIDIPAVELPEIASLGNSFVFFGQNGLSGCEACALVGDPGARPRYLGNGDFWNDNSRDEEIEKARKLAHGHFFYFEHAGKSYIVEDPAIVSQIESMVQATDDLRSQMKALSQQQRGESEQERAQIREEVRKQREAAENLPKPDLTEALAQLNAAADSLKNAQGDTVTREQLAELQKKLSELQGKIIASEVKVNMAANSAEWSKLSQEMSKYSQQMGALGSQFGKLAAENRSKLDTIIDDSLKNGKAQPVN